MAKKDRPDLVGRGVEIFFGGQSPNPQVDEPAQGSADGAGEVEIGKVPEAAAQPGRIPEIAGEMAANAVVIEVERIPESEAGMVAGAAEATRIPEPAEEMAADAVEAKRPPKPAEELAAGAAEIESAPEVAEHPVCICAGSTGGPDGAAEEARRASEAGVQAIAVGGRTATGEEEDVTTTADQDRTGEDDAVMGATVPSWATEPARPALDPLPTREAPERELLSLTGELRDHFYSSIQQHFLPD